MPKILDIKNGWGAGSYIKKIIKPPEADPSLNFVQIYGVKAEKDNDAFVTYTTTSGNSLFCIIDSNGRNNERNVIFEEDFSGTNVGTYACISKDGNVIYKTSRDSVNASLTNYEIIVKANPMISSHK